MATQLLGKELSRCELLTLRTLVQTGSVRVASERMHRSPNTLSTHLKRAKLKWGLEADGNVGTVRLVIEYIRRYGV